MSNKQGENVVITLGDPSGCGPEITFRALNSIIDLPVNFWVVGDRYIAEQIPEYQPIKNRISFLNSSTKDIEKIKRGSISKLAGQASLNYLEKALSLISKNGYKRLVTAPVSKEAVSLIRPGFSGHTEFLRDYFKLDQVVMLMFSQKIKTVLLTRHIQLDKIKDVLSKDFVLNTINLTYSFFKKQLKIDKPNIAVASVNPHAGRDTFMDREEKIITTAIDESEKNIYGPYPADTLFTKDNLKKFDCIIAAYHDQGMIPFKLLSFSSGVNITLGLPIVRTSPDHGVAYDLVKSNPEAIFHSSMEEAIKRSLEL